MALLLTTCNRVEVYAASEKRVSTDAIAGCLVRKIDDAPHNSAPPFYRYEDENCAQHLFRVTSGLESMVVGETEILGQAKKAYESARATGTAGPCLHRLFQRAFRVAKQVRTHTEITRGSVSVPARHRGRPGGKNFRRSREVQSKLFWAPEKRVSGRHARSSRAG